MRPTRQVRILPPDGLEARAMDGGPSVAQLFTHVHYVRQVFGRRGPDTIVQWTRIASRHIRVARAATWRDAIETMAKERFFAHMPHELQSWGLIQ